MFWVNAVDDCQNALFARIAGPATRPGTSSARGCAPPPCSATAAACSLATPSRPTVTISSVISSSISVKPRAGGAGKVRVHEHVETSPGVGVIMRPPRSTSDAARGVGEVVGGVEREGHLSMVPRLLVKPSRLKITQFDAGAGEATMVSPPANALRTCQHGCRQRCRRARRGGIGEHDPAGLPRVGGQARRASRTTRRRSRSARA